jgi:hypothetical protein
MASIFRVTLVSCSAYSSTLKMETICSSETSVDFQRVTRRYIPEDKTLHNHRCENLKSYFHLSVLLHPPFYFSVLLSCHPASLFTQVLLVITFASDKHFGLVAVGRSSLEGNTAVSRKEVASGAVIPTMHGTSLHSFCILAVHDGFRPLVSVLTLPGDGLRAPVCPLLPGIHETCP